MVSDVSQAAPYDKMAPESTMHTYLGVQEYRKNISHFLSKFEIVVQRHWTGLGMKYKNCTEVLESGAYTLVSRNMYIHVYNDLAKFSA